MAVHCGVITTLHRLPEPLPDLYYCSEPSYRYALECVPTVLWHGEEAAKTHGHVGNCARSSTIPNTIFTYWSFRSYLSSASSHASSYLSAIIQPTKLTRSLEANNVQERPVALCPCKPGILLPWDPNCSDQR